MFTGIVEATGIVASLEQEGENLHITIRTDLAPDLSVDQSVAHNGVCLTIEKTDADSYTVTAIAETLSKTNIGKWQLGDAVNLERCLKIGDRLDGHMVQGHVDTTAELIQIEPANGSYLLTFQYPKIFSKNIVSKGSICVNGISLTVVSANDQTFSVAIIPYTWEHTNLNTLQLHDTINIEFDIIGKYVERMMSAK